MSSPGGRDWGGGVGRRSNFVTISKGSRLEAAGVAVMGEGEIGLKNGEP